ncbi:MBL fold metallo-hydrolase [Paenibacillus mucilaginosus]|uniref:Beta-lactamase domain-containing protein n=1 Tax=Paenibacillus mucilaginosus (strain KNP414) TaxID=1036673 RepID=F8FKN8_PAEMK|nr:MBL fold metallo-hydrolase [Paenibacillus mucilaginosus]AEI46406.1 beta-lactamase domain-containing protein [Paenibacillus mucilaginosus KNP414]MCG7213484.1 MBL fold metallo-hydrolase [Paenibacillus mucilaginosus]WDM27698.1 MBL fold metallo-hydrolase [Paenibacillus mucilaginosus]
MPLTIQHIRNATSLITLNGKVILVDPMLSAAGELPPVPFTRSLRRNPITPLPVPLSAFEKIDAILLTHVHFDHFDQTAKNVLPKDIPLFCQPADRKQAESCGFRSVHPIEDAQEWCGITFKRIRGQHAKGIVSKLLGPVSGFILSTPGEGSLYIVGDCILTEEIRRTVEQYRPDVCLVNAPRAQMLLGSIITMTPQDIVKILELSPASRIVAVHMEAISHCTLTRKDLSRYLEAHHAAESVMIPEDGEFLYF